MNLDPTQKHAIDRCLHRARHGGSIKVFGKAGTGKTTTGLEIVKAILATGRDVRCCAYTNKAVNRMKEVGYPADKCTTVNRLLYSTVIKVEIGEFEFTDVQADILLNTDVSDETSKAKARRVMAACHVPKEKMHEVVRMVKDGYAGRDTSAIAKTDEELSKVGISRQTVILVDETSMLQLDHAEHIREQFDTVIYVGDPGQLPPVNSVDTCQYLSCDEHIELTEIHRVSGNERLLDIIYSLDAGKIPAGTSTVTPEEVQDLAREGYKFICYTNDGVAWLNEWARDALGHESYPKVGEPLISATQCTAYRAVIITDDNRSWFEANRTRLEDRYKTSRGRAGAIFEIDEEFHLSKVWVFRSVSKNMALTCEGEPVPGAWKKFEIPVKIEGDTENIWTVKTVAFWSMNMKMKRSYRRAGTSMTLDFAYAITAHKAQGSEWPKVAVMLRQVYRADAGDDELTNEVRRWNYTAATRGREDIKLFTSIVGCQYG